MPRSISSGHRKHPFTVLGGRRKPRPVPGKEDGLGRPGLPNGLVADLVRRQGGRCAICGRFMPTPVIDHDHELARLHPHPVNSYCVRCVRGILCGHCNTVLGFARDDPDTLERAAAYVRLSRERRA